MQPANMPRLHFTRSRRWVHRPPRTPTRHDVLRQQVLGDAFRMDNAKPTSVTLEHCTRTLAQLTCSPFESGLRHRGCAHAVSVLRKTYGLSGCTSACGALHRALQRTHERNASPSRNAGKRQQALQRRDGLYGSHREPYHDDLGERARQSPVAHLELLERGVPLFGAEVLASRTGGMFSLQG